MSRFDLIAANWDQDTFRTRMGEAIASAMEARLTLRPDMALMDLGAGTGLVTLRLAPRVNSVLAVDTSAGMLKVFDAKIQTQGLARITTRLWNIEQDPLLDERFDILVSSMTLHHLQDMNAVAARIRDLLNPGGQIALADLDAETGDFHGDTAGVKHFGFQREILSSHFTQAGFQDIKIETACTLEKPGKDGVPKKFGIFILWAKKPLART